MKWCGRCKQFKSEEEFVKNRAQKDGLSVQCKDCIKIYRTSEGARIHKRACDRRWYEIGGRDIVIARQHTPIGRDNKRKASIQYRIKYPERLLAHNQLEYAVRSGKISRPINCENCHSECIPVGHHYAGYEPEHWYDVQWLCNACHIEVHREKEVINV